MKIKALMSASAVLAALMPANPIAAQNGGELLYNTTYYSDASHSQSVGFLRGSCTQAGVRYRLIGTRTNYSDEYPVGMCVGGILYPL